MEKNGEYANKYALKRRKYAKTVRKAAHFKVIFNFCLNFTYDIRNFAQNIIKIIQNIVEKCKKAQIFLNIAASARFARLGILVFLFIIKRFKIFI